MVRSSRRRRAAQSNAGVVEKRNARERARVGTINEAFYNLRACLPTLKCHNKRVSKLKILQTAINHVYALLDELEAAVSVCASTRNLKQPPTVRAHRRSTTIEQTDSIFASRQQLPRVPRLPSTKASSQRAKQARLPPSTHRQLRRTSRTRTSRACRASSASRRRS